MTMDDDKVCSKCGEVVTVDYEPYGYGRYEAHCRCTQKAKEEAERKERYDFRSGCRDKSYKQPTLGDLLRLQQEKK